MTRAERDARIAELMATKWDPKNMRARLQELAELSRQNALEDAEEKIEALEKSILQRGRAVMSASDPNDLCACCGEAPAMTDAELRHLERRVRGDAFIPCAVCFEVNASSWHGGNGLVCVECNLRKGLRPGTLAPNASGFLARLESHGLDVLFSGERP